MPLWQLNALFRAQWMLRALLPASPLLLLRLPPQLQAQPVRSGSALDTYFDDHIKAT